jgi:hypothetical protein
MHGPYNVKLIEMLLSVVNTEISVKLHYVLTLSAVRTALNHSRIP